jgi:hypothetical protein
MANDNPARDNPPSPDAVQRESSRTGKYRKKPVVIEAFKLGHDPMPDWFCDARSAGVVVTGNLDGRWRGGPDYAVIDTLEGQMRANYGDWIIRGVKGEIYPCKPDIFEVTHEPA